MLSTGDVQGGLRRLEALLRGIKYPGQVDYSGLSKGDPAAVLPIVSFTLTSFSPLFAEQLMAAGLELTGKTDLRFTDGLYKVMLRDVFHYKPVLTKQQFLQWGFSQRKLSMVCDVISLVVQRHKQLRKVRSRSPRGASVRTAAHVFMSCRTESGVQAHAEGAGKPPPPLVLTLYEADLPGASASDL
uniref:Centrosomal protein of 44 kDa n=1 Tax=Salarias fasciatus TaxID=181472 RepID=A0A672I7F6_SALFA